VVKDGNNEVEGCHRTRAGATKQLAALNISEKSSYGPWRRAKNKGAS